MSDVDQVTYTDKSIGLKEKLFIIAMLVCLCGALLLPVMQASRHREIALSLSTLDKELVELEEQRRILQSKIAETRMPEHTEAAAKINSFSLADIIYEKAKIVVVEDLP